MENKNTEYINKVVDAVDALTPYVTKEVPGNESRSLIIVALENEGHGGIVNSSFAGSEKNLAISICRAMMGNSDFRNVVTRAVDMCDYLSDRL